ncbi:unnamed protein product [Adineta steineri]|uniref:Glycosyl hydrolase family 13 catalytic domain-containing protein n=1 Tax=Adineta steineri TaxID=433720 RepID=A0A814EZD9_9BILA|nr:unnamed protein product [Adineta steineri]CAF1124421.1 unnamed protein product [Adineta steineri]
MSEKIQISKTKDVSDEAHQVLIVDGSDVQTKVGHVAKFHPSGEQNIVVDEIVQYKKPKENNEFIGLTAEELKAYINDPKWKRIRLIIALLYILLLIALLIGSILLIIYTQRCPPKPVLEWYQKDIIYEIDVSTFRDSNGDGIGDIKGIQEKLPYFEKNNIKSILLQSSIFNVSGGTSIKLDGQIPHDKNIDLKVVDPNVGGDNDLQELAKILNRKDMRLIIDLPLASTHDPNGVLWYGSLSLPSKIEQPCRGGTDNLGCQYLTSYGRLPLDFNQEEVSSAADDRIRYWLSTKKIDGIRVNLPLEYNQQTRLYTISYRTIKHWSEIKTEIEKAAKPKLFLFDIPFGLQRSIETDDLHNKTAHSLFLLDPSQRSNINAESLNTRIQSFENNNRPKPQFWQLGSIRKSDDIGTINENQLSKEMILTMGMLFGGTPIILYGEEIGLDQKSTPLMSWTSDSVTGGFCARNAADCENHLKNNYKIAKTSVKRQEALGGVKRDSLLTVFRHLAKLRQQESFQFGVLETGFHADSNSFWFIREAPGHRGYVVLFNLKKQKEGIAHISLRELTEHDVPHHVHYEYQWPTAYLPTSNDTHIDSDNLLIHPQSINIFWWTAKLIKPNVLFKNAKEHTHTH